MRMRSTSFFRTINNEQSIDIFLYLNATYAVRDPSHPEVRCAPERVRKEKKRSRYATKREGNRTTLERTVSPGGYEVYALKAF